MPSHSFIPLGQITGQYAGQSESLTPATVLGIHVSGPRHPLYILVPGQVNISEGQPAGQFPGQEKEPSFALVETGTQRSYRHSSGPSTLEHFIMPLSHVKGHWALQLVPFVPALNRGIQISGSEHPFIYD